LSLASFNLIKRTDKSEEKAAPAKSTNPPTSNSH
jgi:hypothetical protein